MVHNFSAGPAILPQEVFIEASEAVLNFNNLGLSILEISHRSPDYQSVMNEAVSSAQELMGLPSDYKVIFLQGGASMQFCMIPYNLMRTKAAYLDTGVWASKAIKEAKLFGECDVVASSKDSVYNYIPKAFTTGNDSDYFHITTNNTIYGTFIKEIPRVDIPIVADVSSELFSRRMDFSKFGLVYAGAQKNLGPAGATMVAVREDLLGKADRQIPSMLNYQIHIDKGSMFNTPPAFAIYVSMLTMRWIKKMGGLVAMEKRNVEKAELLYLELENNDLFKAHVPLKADRSLMNVTFRLINDDLNSDFLELCKKANISGIKGHRSVGGFRASMYNAMGIESVQALVEVMREFSNKKG